MPSLHDVRQIDTLLRPHLWAVQCPSLVGLKDLQAINVHISGQFVTERLVQDKPNQINSTIMFIKTLGASLMQVTSRSTARKRGMAWCKL